MTGLAGASVSSTDFAELRQRRISITTTVPEAQVFFDNEY
jgi:hypothetical protein